MIIFVMGPSGCGKSTIGALLADQVGCSYYEADDYHSQENRMKMGNGIPLTDDDRLPWLHLLSNIAVQASMDNQSAVISCSALKAKYRRLLAINLDRNNVIFIHLNIGYEAALKRMTARQNHYFKADLLRSQLEILEPVNAIEEDYLGMLITIDVDEQSVEDILEELKSKLSL